MDKLTDTYTLRGGVQIPCVGFGTWAGARTARRRSVRSCRRSRPVTGTLTPRPFTETRPAWAKPSAPAALRAKSCLSRQSSGIRTGGYERTLAAFDLSLKKLGLDYLDLFLIHWPANRPRDGMSGEQCNLESWRAMEKLYRDGRVRAIGLSNFLPHHIAPILACAEVAPMVDQIEFHPGVMQPEAVEYCRKHGILVEAWSPLGRGLVLDHPLLRSVAEKHGKSPAQVCVRWCLQHGTLPRQSRSQKSGLRKTRRCSISRWMRRIWPQ